MQGGNPMLRWSVVMVFFALVVCALVSIPDSLPDKKFAQRPAPQSRSFAAGEQGHTDVGRAADHVPPVFPAASSGSSDAEQDFLAQIAVLHESTSPDGKGLLKRRRLAHEHDGPGLYVIDEMWRPDKQGAPPRLVSRVIFSATQFLIRVAPGTNPDDLRATLASRGMRLSRAIGADVFVVEIPEPGPESVDRAIDSVADLVLQSERDGLGFGAGAAPNDPYFPNQWNLRNTGQSGGKSGVDIGAMAMWDRLTNVPAVKVAVLDTGLRFNHPDFKLAWQGYDFVNNDAYPSDDNGHGSDRHLARRARHCGEGARQGQKGPDLAFDRRFVLRAHERRGGNEPVVGGVYAARQKHK